MNRRGELDVIVVAAGIAGSAMALALVRDGCVVALAADAVAMFDDLGVWADVLAARASAWQRMRVWDASAPGQLEFDSADRGEAALGWIVENRLLQHVLWRALVKAVDDGQLLSLRCPAEVTAVETETGGVAVNLADGTRLRSRLLVAADGANSPIRTQIGIATTDRDYGQRAIVAHVGTERSHQSTAWQRFQPGGPLAFLPLADGRSSIVWSLQNDEAARLLALDDARFCAELGCALDFRLGAITSTTQRFAFPLRMRLAQRYVGGRCVLLGDAAHAVHPLAGQGLNLGLRDVRNLREQLLRARARNSDHGAAHVLRRYERERRSENAIAAHSFSLIERSFNSDSTAIAGLRGLALGIANRITPLKRHLADAAAGRL